MNMIVKQRYDLTCFSVSKQYAISPLRGIMFQSTTRTLLLFPFIIRRKGFTFKAYIKSLISVSITKSLFRSVYTVVFVLL